ncbi:class I SAM-dependent methyltransferase [Methanolobus bombayensis]|uniref:class I SAM-dependent methyltransferase n=1 Tax=Methanolobus bombayensis TaxID=38023 RepID=UPI001FD7AB25|nr:class I SAM-dependent methyltransferase family protein [Methanolobus bombayensis]MBP1910003.1 tRNA wybutosine-synthesizing protein 2 [Methanolobus bombayensis]
MDYNSPDDRKSAYNLIKMRKCIRVPIKNAEKVRIELADSGRLDQERKIKVIDKGQLLLEIPVTENIEGFKTYIQESPEFYKKWQSLEDTLRDDISADELEKLPSGWHIIGKVIIVTIDPSIDHLKLMIAETLLRMYPSCNTVVRDLGISGQFRLPKREILIGNNTETINKEHGCLFKLDVTKVMFSKGNLHEKKLMSKIGMHETIVDMFAGIGYFTIPMAVHAKPEKIIAIEINPESCGYLKKNIALNKVEHIVEARNGDCAELAPKGVADRVLMGYVNTTHHYLDSGIAALKPEGGVIHYHETTPESQVFSRPIKRIENAALKAGRTFEILDCRKIKKYSPGVWHVVVDARIS